MKHVIIFCQASKDLKYSLAICHDEIAKGKKVVLVVREVFGVYLHVKGMNLDSVEILFMPTYVNKTLKSVFLNYRSALNIIKVINKYKLDSIYFFSQYFDLLTPFIIKKTKCKTVCFYDHYKRESLESKKINSYDLVRKLIALVVFRMKVEFKGEAKFLFVDSDYLISNYVTETEVELNSCYINKPKISSNIPTKSVVFFDSNDEDNMVLLNSESNFFEFSKICFDNGYRVFVKGHPRSGLSKYITEDKYTILDKDVPSEFIDFSDFKYVFSVYGSSLSEFENDKAYSLLGFYDVTNSALYKNYLKGIGIVDSQFINSISELENLLS